MNFQTGPVLIPESGGSFIKLPGIAPVIRSASTSSEVSVISPLCVRGPLRFVKLLQAAVLDTLSTLKVNLIFSDLY